MQLFVTQIRRENVDSELLAVIYKFLREYPPSVIQQVANPFTAVGGFRAACVGIGLGYRRPKGLRKLG